MLPNKNPLITVYVTNYNYGRFIVACIESLLHQTCQDFEVIIIDDGSTDNSKEIIESYRHVEKVSIIYQQNKGLNITNNIAMRAAQGKYIMRLDADDFLEPNALELMSSKLEQDDKLGLVFPDYYYVDRDGNRIGEEKRHNFDENVSLYDQPAHGACTMIRLEYLRKLGGYNESFTCQDGYDLWIKFITHYPVSNIRIPLFSYRQHGNNLTSNELRILSTRQKIKDLHIETFGVELPTTIAIIPLRRTLIAGVDWLLFSINKDETVLSRLLQTVAASKKVEKFIVTTSDIELIQYCRKFETVFSNLLVVERPSAFEELHETLSKTIHLVLNQQEIIDLNPTAILTIAADFPFLTTEIIDDAINTLSIFQADSLLSVRPDNRMYYQHTGHGMQPLLDQYKFTKLEREALYSGMGGIVAATVDSFKKSDRMVAGKVGHIVVDQKAALGVFSPFDLEVFKALIQ
ncbi:glycosyltransferase [Flavobacterium sp.]|uniref:glycosyltransferase n=1 Tax=Flavobacterium sp. TaxID=239 RepID=UPI0026147ED9|nr:glycosyltransferase [Flavobacterium sp.]